MSISPSSAAGEPDPGEPMSMLDHAAIVEANAWACERSRSDLAAPFRDGQQLWWRRNSEVHGTLATVEPPA